MIILPLTAISSHVFFSIFRALRDVEVDCDDTADEEKMSSLQLYAKLKELDPERADHIHPNEKRKILRSLEIFKSTGQTHGQLLKEQKEVQGGRVLGGPLRFPKEDLAVLWVKCEEKVLDQRCDKRVHQMIAEGLLGELNAFHKVRFRFQRAHHDYMCVELIFSSLNFKF